MVNADPARTPTFTLFGQDDFFITAGSNPTCGGNPCVSPGFAWNHGDVQQQIANTWVGIVGPGVANDGVDRKTWTDHTNLRPTIMALTGLKDDYVEDGRVLTETMQPNAVPATLNGATAARLAQALRAAQRAVRRVRQRHRHRLDEGHGIQRLNVHELRQLPHRAH